MKHDSLFRVTWSDGRRQSQWFDDKFDAQDLIVSLQKRGISPRVNKVTQQERRDGDEYEDSGAA